MPKPKQFPWDAIHTESFFDALRKNDLPGYYQRQAKVGKKLQRYLKQIRKDAILKQRKKQP